jgi:hypothetical protein
MKRIHGVLSGLAMLAWLSLGAAVGHAQAPANPQLAGVLAGLAERAQHYYDRLTSILCVETVTQQELKFNLSPTGKPRVTVYELAVTRDPRAKAASEFRVERKLQSVNGKRAGKWEEPGCTDPKTGTPEPLGFLLAKNQHEFRFSLADAGPDGPAGALAIDFVQAPPERVAITWHDNCFDAEGGGQEGRLWFDPQTYDVLQMQVRLPKPFLIPIPSGIFGSPSMSVRVEKSDMAMRFTRIKFQNPDETVLLPEFTEVVTLFRGVPSLRTVQILSDFRRFLAESTFRPAL